jgi:hypothetical protein
MKLFYFELNFSKGGLEDFLISRVESIVVLAIILMIILENPILIAIIRIRENIAPKKVL